MNKYTNFKMEEIPKWDLVRLRNTKEYQEKRKKFIEENGGKCKFCDSIEYLTISHPQEYIKIICKDGVLYSSYQLLKYKDICPICGFDKAYEINEEYKNKKLVKHNKKYKFKYQCLSCKTKYKYPKKISMNKLNVLRKLTYGQSCINSSYYKNEKAEFVMDIILVMKGMRDKINKQQWEKYLSFIDAQLVCRDCHYTEHFIPLTIIRNVENLIKTPIKNFEGYPDA